VGLVLSILPLYGALYRSNSLGQRLELLLAESSLSDYPYVVRVQNPSTDVKESSLFKDGKEIRRSIEVTDPTDLGKRIVTETTYGNDGKVDTVVTTFFSGDLPQRVEQESTGVDGKYHILYRYEDGRLVETKELLDGMLVRLTTYYRGDEGMLAGLRTIDLDQEARDSFFTDDGRNPVYGEYRGGDFTRITFHPGNLVIRDVWSDQQPKVATEVAYDEAGRLVVNETVDGRLSKKIYGPDGMLLRLETTGEDGNARTVTYQYDANGVLDQSVETISGEQTRRIESWYGGGALQNQTEWVDDRPVKATRYVADGTSVVTLFEEGRPYVDITYAPDGKRVLSLEYRKER